MLNAVVHSIILYFMMMNMFVRPGSEPDGSSSGLWLSGAGVNFVLVLVVNAKVGTD